MASASADSDPRNDARANDHDPKGGAQGVTVDAREVEQFSAIADAWWDPDGAFKPLHRLNPVRVAYVRDRLAAHFGRATDAPKPLEGLRVLDLGCGGGLLSEPLTRLGADVVGVDAAQKNIQVARLHAEAVGLDIDYRCTTAEALVEAGERFDAVASLEVIEHVADPGAFMAACAALLKERETEKGQSAYPGGLFIGSTLNRTAKSFLFAIVGAEYVMRWLPRGTHDWRRFLRPSEFAALLREAGLTVGDIAGMTYHPVSDDWSLGRDLSVNYLITAER